jgi:4-amino-4-deoxy-L-arabinose transferase-like glycosyltransferase
LSTQKKVFLLIIFSTLVRSVLAHFLEFGNDEVYYWTYAQHLQWNYFDHPPIVALLIRFSTFNLYLHNELFVRGGSIICAGINTFLVYLTGKKVADEKAGWYAALLYTSSCYCSIIAGTFILPDSPQVLFWVLGIYLLVGIIDQQTSPKNRNSMLLLAGIVFGLCMMCKVHGVFLWVGFGLYILFYDRKLLAKPALYIAVLLSALIVSPILIWNMENNFITYSFHNSRVGFFDKHLDWDGFLQQVFGSIAYNNPINFILYVIGILGIIKDKNALKKNYLRIFLLLGLPLIMVLLVMSLFNETLPHWSGPAYISLLLITAVYFSQKRKEQQKPPAAILAANFLILFAVVAGMLVIRYIPLQLGKKEERVLGDGDITLDMTGWRNFAGEFNKLRNADIKKGLMSANSFIISDKWFPAANLDYYVATPLRIRLFAAGKLLDLHNYAWLNQTRPHPESGDDAYFIFPSNYYNAPKKGLRDFFEHTDDPELIPQYRSAVHVRDFVIIRLHHYKGGLPSNGVIEN